MVQTDFLFLSLEINGVDSVITFAPGLLVVAGDVGTAYPHVTSFRTRHRASYD